MRTSRRDHNRVMAPDDPTLYDDDRQALREQVAGSANFWQALGSGGQADGYPGGGQALQSEGRTEIWGRIVGQSSDSTVPRNYYSFVELAQDDNGFYDKQGGLAGTWDDTGNGPAVEGNDNQEVPVGKPPVAADPNASPPVKAQDSSGGAVVRLTQADDGEHWIFTWDPCQLWAQLTAGDGSGKYAWQEVEPAPDGTWRVIPNGRTGNLACYPAWEVNGNGGVPLTSPAGTPTVVQLFCGNYDRTTTSTTTSTSTTTAGCSTSTTTSTSTTACEDLGDVYWRFSYCCGSSGTTGTTGTTQPPCQGTCKWTCSNNTWVLTSNNCKTCGGTTCKCAGPIYCCGICGNPTETTITFCVHGDTQAVNCGTTSSTTSTSTSTTSSTTTTSGGGNGNTGCSGCTWTCLGGNWILKTQDCVAPCFQCNNPHAEGQDCNTHNNCEHYKNGCVVQGSGGGTTQAPCTGACTWFFDGGLLGFSGGCAEVTGCMCEVPDMGNGCGIVITGCSVQTTTTKAISGTTTSSTSSTSSTTQTTTISNTTTTTAACTGTCRWQWDAGAGVWRVSCSDCPKFCLCSISPPYSGTDDGETAEEPCSNTTTTSSTTTTTTSSTSSTTTSSTTTACGTCKWTCENVGVGYAWQQIVNGCTGLCNCNLPPIHCDAATNGTNALTVCGTTTTSTTTSTTSSTTTTLCGTCGYTCQLVTVGQAQFYFWSLTSQSCTGACSCVFPGTGCFPEGSTTNTNCNTTTSTTTTSTTTCTTTSLPAPTCGQCWWWKPQNFSCTSLNSWILYATTCTAACNCPSLTCPPSSLYPGCQDAQAINPAPISNCQTTSTTTSTTTTPAGSMACWTCSGPHAGVYCSVTQPFPGCTSGAFTYASCAACQAACPGAPCI